jgi:hypothetical protein
MMAKKTDLIRVDRSFSDALRRASVETNESIVDISARIAPQIRRRDRRDPFELTVI